MPPEEAAVTRPPMQNPAPNARGSDAESGAGLDDIYQDRLLALADPIIRQGHAVQDPSFTAKAVSRACGSSIEIEVRIEDGVVVDYGQQVEACALGSASASVVGAAIVGARVDEVRLAGQALEAMLKAGGVAPSGRFAELEALSAARGFKNRHASILLAFSAFEKGLRTLSGDRS
jgi:NifU-like protein involved in Fe-S cluster formation